MIRIFPDLHVTESRRAQQPPRQQCRGPGRFGQRRPGWGGASSPTRGVNAAEVEDRAEDYEDEQPQDDWLDDGFEGQEHEVNEVEVSEIQGFVRHELEALATDLEDSTVDLPDEDTAALEEAALQVSQFSEALEIIRDARGRIKGRAGGKGGKGKGRGKTAGRPLSIAGSDGQRGGKGKELAEKLRRRKLSSRLARPAGFVGTGQETLSASPSGLRRSRRLARSRTRPTTRCPSSATWPPSPGRHSGTRWSSE